MSSSSQGAAGADKVVNGFDCGDGHQPLRKRRRLLVAPALQTILQPAVRVALAMSAETERPAAAPGKPTADRSSLPEKVTDIEHAQALSERTASEAPPSVLEESLAAQDAHMRTSEAQTEEAHRSEGTAVSANAAESSRGVARLQGVKCTVKPSQAFKRPAFLRPILSSTATEGTKKPLKTLKTPATHLNHLHPLQAEAAIAQAPRKSNNSDGGYVGPGKRLTFAPPAAKAPSAAKPVSCQLVPATHPKLAAAGSQMRAISGWAGRTLQRPGISTAHPQKSPSGLTIHTANPTCQAHVATSEDVAGKCQAGKTSPESVRFAAEKEHPAIDLGLQRLTNVHKSSMIDTLPKQILGIESEAPLAAASPTAGSQMTNGLSLSQELVDLGLLTPTSQKRCAGQDQGDLESGSWDGTDAGGSSRERSQVEAIQSESSGSGGWDPRRITADADSASDSSVHDGHKRLRQKVKGSASALALALGEDGDVAELAGQQSPLRERIIEDIARVQLIVSGLQPSTANRLTSSGGGNSGMHELPEPRLPASEILRDLTAMPSLTFLLGRLRQKPLTEALLPALLVSRDMMRSIQQGLLPPTVASPRRSVRALGSPLVFVKTLTSARVMHHDRHHTCRMTPMHIPKLQADPLPYGGAIGAQTDARDSAADEVELQRQKIEEILGSREMQAAELIRAIEDKQPGVFDVVRLAFS